MAIKSSEHTETMEVLVISACPADLQLCLGVIRDQPSDFKLLMLITWGDGKFVEHFTNLVSKDKSLNMNVAFVSSLNAYNYSKEKRWNSIYLFTMGADWLGRILHERKDVLCYKDCYLDSQQLHLRDVKWNHLEVIKFHGLKHWLKLQIQRVVVFIKNHQYKLELRPDMHIWPPTEDMHRAWQAAVPDSSFKLGILPGNAVIFCLSSVDNGWSPNWSEIKKISDNFFYKLHPRTGSPDYLEYPEWVRPLEGYDFPIELYDCPDSSLLVGTTSTALASTRNSMSLWYMKLLDWKNMKKTYSAASVVMKGFSMDYMNCRNDLYDLYHAYAQRAEYLPENNHELVQYANAHHQKSL